MDARKQRVLQAIVTLYTSDGEPIGSHLLGEYLDMAVSTATLRNEMAALTRLGLLEQPHTSAGRVPSGAGYRYYIEHLMHADPLREEQKADIDAAFAAFDRDPPRLAQDAARALYETTGLAAAVTTPRDEDMRMVHFHLTQVGGTAVAVLGVNSAGGVMTRVAHTEDDLREADVQAAETLLNRALAFLTAQDLTTETPKALADSLSERAADLLPVMRAACRLVQEAGRALTAVEGLDALLRYPETAGCLAPLLQLASDRARLARYSIPPGEGLHITLGSDPASELPGGTALVSRRYVAGNGLRGGIALLGPDRMPYHKLAPVLDHYALRLGQAMSGRARPPAS